MYPFTLIPPFLFPELTPNCDNPHTQQTNFFFPRACTFISSASIFSFYLYLWVCPRAPQMRLLYMCPHTAIRPSGSYICVLILLYAPHTIIYVSSYYYTPLRCGSYICVLILLYAPQAPIYVSSYYYTPLRLLYMCPHTTIRPSGSYICVLILLYAPHTIIYVSSYYYTPLRCGSYICVLIILYECPHI